MSISCVESCLMRYDAKTLVLKGFRVVLYDKNVLFEG